MNVMIALRPLLILLFAAPHCASASSIESIVAQYERYERMTPEPVPPNPALAEACAAHIANPALGPHDGLWMTVFMNEAAAAAFRSTTPRYPEGAVVLKRKQDREGRPQALGGMVKRAAGYDPANADWEFFYLDIGDQPTSGRLENCGDCHSRARDEDFVFGDWGAPRSSPSRLTQ